MTVKLGEPGTMKAPGNIDIEISRLELALSDLGEAYVNFSTKRQTAYRQCNREKTLI